MTDSDFDVQPTDRELAEGVPIPLKPAKDAATALVAALGRCDLAPERMAVDVTGGVFLIYRLGSLDLHVLCDNEGDVIATISDDAAVILSAELTLPEPPKRA